MIQQDAEQALGKLRLATIRLAEKYLYYAGILQRFALRPNSSVGTMGVTIGDGTQIQLLFDPSFVLNLPVTELVGVVQHEVLHVLFSHLWWVPEEFPDPRAKVIAEEVTVNEYVSEPLPAGVMRISDFGLPPWESTRTRYERLKQALSQPGVGQGGGEQAGASGGSSTAQDGAQGQGSAPGNGSGPLDNHEMWSEISLSREDLEELVADLISPSPDRGNDLPRSLQKAISKEDAEGVGIGVMPGRRVERIGKDQATLDWQKVLRAFVGRALERYPNFCWPNRRCPELVGVIPGVRRQQGKPVVMAGVDCSGSMTADPKLLSLVNGELSRLATKFEVVVVECDVMIQRVYKYRPIKNVHGGGGTSFLPPFEPKFLRKQKVDVVVYFTDGFGPAPNRAPHVPVLWCLTAKGRAPARWGRLLRMSR